MIWNMYVHVYSFKSFKIFKKKNCIKNENEIRYTHGYTTNLIENFGTKRMVIYIAYLYYYILISQECNDLFGKLIN